jgi:hypothetical protein
MKRNDIIESLREGICEFRFTKLDGQIREMTATLREDTIPEIRQSQEASRNAPKEITEETAIRVYDLDIQEWRSFRPQSLISFMNHFGKNMI